ncbi:MAG TPA: leucine--tRNA ligase [Candidatus Saccharibacteria bacterium]|jgi:leucyl-tRNA synthetase|nr:leucine--tRNA ligase [Candidatus Saccharibacteria bacterium]
MKRYNPNEIEPKWQQQWLQDRLYEVNEDENTQKIYATPMLPYPSGSGLHTGHVRNYSISDAVARYYRQRGHNVMTNIAWDAFGLPAENYAIKTGTPPAESTANNIAYFKKQLQRLGISFAWEREFNTSDPSYYRWTQWLFSLMYERGLAYQAEKMQWWCDQCKTVLADEQVVGGKCWRHDGDSDPLVTKKSLNQWFFKITSYADAILDATDALDWPEKIKTMQKNWIGRSEGTSVRFGLSGLSAESEHLDIFTTAVETIFGATFMVLAPEHPIVGTYGQLADNASEISDYVIRTTRKSELDREAGKEKTGVKIEGLTAINPLNGQEIEVWVADYVLMGYGSGAIMAVPGQDERDFAFAEKFGIPIVFTTDRNEFVNYAEEIKHNKSAFRMANSGEFDGQNLEEARIAIIKKLETIGAGEKKTHYKIRDWLISRQRYWGAPIPIIHCEEHGAVLVPASELPVELPPVTNFAPDGSNHSVLAGVDSWVNTTCPTCGKPAKRETDTMDGYVCSTWYLHRYTDAHNNSQAFEPAKAAYWFPLDFYFGGDHAVAHLLYIRFFQRVLVDAGIMPAELAEPVRKLVYNGYINAEDGTKMSKSKGNTVDPMDIIESGYGADALRVFELFIAPYDQDTPWNTNGVPGTYKFLNRIWTLTQEFLESTDSAVSQANDHLDRVAHRTIKKVTDDMQQLSFNTAVATMMGAINEAYLVKASVGYVHKSSWDFFLSSIIQLVGPFAPHLAEELWHQLGNTDSVHRNHWPAFDEAYLLDSTMKLAIQVNGKVRAEIEVSRDASESEVTQSALKQDNVITHLAGKQPKKIIYITGRLISIVV